jgi:tetratricopeptide (TPR) repeat protein
MRQREPPERSDRSWATPPAVHRTIVVADVEGFGDLRRTNAQQVMVRRGMYGALRRAFDRSGVPWEECHREDRGDGVLILVSAQVPKSPLVAALPRELAAALSEHNREHGDAARIRLRLAVHAGEVLLDEHGVTGAAVTMVFRLIEAERLKSVLAASSGTLALIVSRWFFEEVVRQTPDARPSRYRPVRVVVKETETTGWICLPDDPRPPDVGSFPPTRAGIVPRQLPGGVRGFVGRTSELRALDEALDATDAGDTVTILAIDGMAGVGKTALAVHWAHRVVERFPDGQLYVNLRGFDPTGPPVTPAEAVRGFLDAFGLPAERIPESPEAQAALYRSLLAGRRMCVVLDNARDAGHVRPLVPGGPGCAVIVTSRNRLTALAAGGARLLTLGLLTGTEARQLLAHRLGGRRISAEPRAAAEIIDSCARLPLALGIATAHAAGHPAFPLSTLAEELRGTRGRLAALDGGEPAANARAVFSWSYDQLDAGAARMFRLLGLLPGPDITVPAAASLVGIGAAQARALLDELARAHLAEEHAPGRFALHDLLREYAADLTEDHDGPAARDAALTRVLDHYLHTAHRAALLLHPRRRPVRLGPPPPGVTVGEPADYAQAWAWFEAEHPVLLAVVQSAAASGKDAHTWRLAWTLLDYLRRRGLWHDLASSHRAARAAAERSRSLLGQAHAWYGLGRAQALLGRDDEAYTYLRNALRLFKELGDLPGEAHIHIGLASILSYRARHNEALFHAERALDISNAADYQQGRALALSSIGWLHTLFGDPRRGLVHCRQALVLYRRIGDRHGEGHALHGAARAYHRLERHQDAIAHLRQALTVRQEIGDRQRQAADLCLLAEAHRATGDVEAAREAWRTALDILDQLPGVAVGAGGVTADSIRENLRELDGEMSPGPRP